MPINDLIFTILRIAAMTGQSPGQLPNAGLIKTSSTSDLLFGPPPAFQKKTFATRGPPPAPGRKKRDEGAITRSFAVPRARLPHPDDCRKYSDSYAILMAYLTRAHAAPPWARARGAPISQGEASLQHMEKESALSAGPCVTASHDAGKAQNSTSSSASSSGSALAAAIQSCMGAQSMMVAQ